MTTFLILSFICLYRKKKALPVNLAGLGSESKDGYQNL
jgi:hypothetical protein